MPAQPKYSPEMCDKLLPLFQKGWTIVEVCQDLGIARKTYYKWKEKHRAFGEAAEFAEEAGEAFMWKLGRNALISNGKLKIDTGLYCFNMKVRFGLDDLSKAQNPNNSETGQPLTIKFGVNPAVSEVTVTNANTDSET